MRVRIHRGAEEIGGSCVEVEASGERLVLDLGLPLNARHGDDVPLPRIAGIESPDASLLGILISHGHPDHYGLLPGIDSRLPLFMGEAAERILKEAEFFGAAPPIPKATRHLADRAPFRLGPFEVTPYLVDHSAFDAYALEIRAGGRALFYSGDLRAHGRKWTTYDRLLRRPPSGINALLLEGTRLSRSGEACDPDENEVEQELLATMATTQGLVLAMYSAQNIDRYVGFYRAALRADRDLVIDLYTAAVAEATGRLETIPQANWDRVRVYVPQSQRVRVKRSGAFSRVDHVRAQRIYAPELFAHPGRFVLTFRQSMAAELERQRLEGASAIWSMWPGYLEEERMSGLHAFLDRNQIPLTVAHASGHARVADLRRFAQALDPDRVVPIHTAAPGRYDQIFERTEPHADGEWWDV